MDQPQQGDDDANQSVNDGAMQDDQSQNTDESTPITDNVESADGETNDEFSSPNESEMNDAVMDGVPSSGEPVQADIQAAEEQVAEAMPQSTADELAQVADELQHMASTEEPAATDEPETQADTPVEEGMPVYSDGSDPMDQIMHDEETNGDSERSEQPSLTPPVENADEASEHEVLDPNAFNADTDSTQTDENTQSDQSDASPEEASIVDQPFSEETAEEVVGDPVVDAVENDQSDDDSEPTMNSDTPVEAPISGGANNDAISMANDAELEKTAEVNLGAMINDVIAPTAVAVASSVGTAGENAITGTPETSTVESAQGAALANQKEHMATKPKSSKMFLVLIVTLVTLLFGGGAVAAYMLRSDPEPTTNSEVQENATDNTEAVESDGDTTPNADALPVTTTSSPGEKVDAKALDDYKAACATGGLISNATAYAGVAPHPIVVFEKGSDDKFALSLVSFKDKTWSADATKVTSGQLVACIARKVASEKKLKSCPITDSVTKVTANVDFYSSSYTVDVYEAKTGKKVTSFENASISTSCPTNAAYNKADPKIYAVFDQIALETSLKDSVTKVF